MFVSLLVSGFYILATGTDISFNSTIIWHCGWSQRAHVTLLRMLCPRDILHQSLTPWHQAAAATLRSTVLLDLTLLHMLCPQDMPHQSFIGTRLQLPHSALLCL